ncbi:hypothetical protein HAX54_018547 [Datura stramonium]|uniref:Uncharacterized protein n=1 Tax=Datura stramonium TaxID=4076 RepID=A0ABS8UPS6_DATST|nr:hypothetical protein [Datura stramonium]
MTAMTGMGMSSPAPWEMGAVATTGFCNGLLGDSGIPKKNEWRYLRILNTGKTKWCMLEYYAWWTVGGPRVHPSGVGYDGVEYIGLADWVRLEILPRMDLTISMFIQTVASSVNHMIQGIERDLELHRTEEDLIEEDPKEDPIEENPIEEDPEEDPNIYDPNEEGIMEVVPGEEPKYIPTQHPERESEGQSKFRPEEHGEEGGWQMGDLEESSEDDFLKYLEYHPGFHYDLSDDDSSTWT